MRGIRSEPRHALRLRVLPARVAWFQWRAHRLARRLDDSFSLASATRPPDLATLLELAAGRSRVVELGTATGWTSIALALANPNRQVTTFDPLEIPIRQQYLALVPAQVRDRITFVTAAGSTGPRSPEPVDLLYIDSSHALADTLAELEAWRPVLRTGSVVVFDDFTHADYPGVREAVAQLQLTGEQRGTMFVHEVAG
jgi:predicted O-methyltransferase YrrM